LTARALPKGEQNAPRNSANRDASKSLEKGLLALTLFDAAHTEWTLGEIRRQLGLPKTTVFRLLKTLVGLGFMDYDPQAAKYHLGPSFHRAVYVTFADAELVRNVHPHMVTLAASTEETVNLAVWTGEWPLIVDSVLTPRPFKPPAAIGMVMEGLASLHSRTFLAFGSEDKREAALAIQEVPRTPYTVVDPERLKEELARIRREGVAYGLQEWAVGMCSVAAPVFGLAGTIRASMSLVAPSERFGPTEMVRYAEAVKHAAAEASKDLGYLSGNS
jgi:DNA-binding IclR family transcriptional regulator